MLKGFAGGASLASLNLGGRRETTHVCAAEWADLFCRFTGVIAAV
jgi:hypothetical protein